MSGLFLVGGPLILFSSPKCAFRQETPWAGTITVSDPATGASVATQTVGNGQLASFDLTPGKYTINGTFANGQANGSGIRATATTVSVPVGRTVRQDITADVP